MEETKLSKVEKIKKQSNYLRGSIKQSLVNDLTNSISTDSSILDLFSQIS